VSGYTISVLDAQRRVLDEVVRESDAKAMALLADRVERAILTAMRPIFFSLKNVPMSAVDTARFARLKDRYPQIDQILFLDADMTVVATLPEARTEAERSINDWLAARAALEGIDKQSDETTLHAFVETIEGRDRLFGLQHIGESDDSAEWLLIRYSLEEIQGRFVTPVLDEFERTQTGKVRLQDAKGVWDDDALNWPVSKILPGWLLVFKPDVTVEERRLRGERALLLGVTAGVVLAMALAAFAAWRELRREHALVDLRNRFVANVSHELKTPLSLIRMYAETLYLNRVADDGRRHEYHRVILREAERLTEMINTVLDFSQLSQGVKVYDLKDMDLYKTVSEIVETYRARIEEQGLRVEMHLHEGLPQVAHDPNAVTQILLNLLDNAAKYGAEGGVVQVALAAKDGSVELSVTDLGGGIPMEDRDRVRQAFQRGRDADPATGSGLGLAVVERIADVHRAKLILDTSPGGQGLKAAIRFPVHKEHK
jgi:signal transduction histidine kinase